MIWPCSYLLFCQQQSKLLLNTMLFSFSTPTTIAKKTCSGLQSSMPQLCRTSRARNAQQTHPLPLAFAARPCHTEVPAHVGLGLQSKYRLYIDMQKWKRGWLVRFRGEAGEAGVFCQQKKGDRFGSSKLLSVQREEKRKGSQGWSC